MPKDQDLDKDPDSAPNAGDLVFPKPCHRFLRQLAAHNDREWFAE